MDQSFRIGQGFDVHRFADGRRLILGGVEIPHDRGLLGHSDADVLTHAITDALLGAAGMGDIGRLFPDTDPAYLDADSVGLLREAWNRVRAQGWSVVNLDATILAERPKIAPHAEAMKNRLAEALEIETSRIHVKATTTEKLGFTGREEGIAAMAVALIAREESR